LNRILVIEDEEAIANLIRMNLVKNGYLCECAYDGADGAEKMNSGKYDLCLIDIMLPKINGYELLEYAKSIELPVIFITAMTEVRHKVKGLKAGADDYISKPFEIVELLARVESVLRRFHKTEQIISIDNVTIDTASRIVMKDDCQILLTLKEFELLLLFVRNKNVALYREVIYEHVWENEYMGDSRTVDLHVQRLRKKMGWEHKIESVYKVGYRLNVKG
jgi:two-component system alkaline phosphatase synthesis response regulator PhoP